MAGYQHDYSKSNNAADAEAEGKFPASEAGRRLGIPGKFVAECCGWASHGEWHHSSKFYNAVQYYDTNEIQAWMDGDAEAVEAHGDFATVLSGWRSAVKISKEKPATLYSPVVVEWLEWGGSRSHPHATERRAENASVIDPGGKFVTVKLKDGSTFKKGRDTNGFKITGADGRRIYL